MSPLVVAALALLLYVKYLTKILKYYGESTQTQKLRKLFFR